MIDMYLWGVMAVAVAIVGAYLLVKPKSKPKN